MLCKFCNIFMCFRNKFSSMRFYLVNRLQFVFICTGVCCLLILLLNMYELHRMQSEHFSYHHQSVHLQSNSTNNEKHLVYIAFGRDVSAF